MPGECLSSAAGHVLNEHRMVIGLHGDVPLVRAFHQRVDRARASCLGYLDQVIRPDRSRLAVFASFRVCGNRLYSCADCGRRNR